MNFKLYWQFTIQRRYQWPDTGCVFTPYCIPLHCGIFKVCSQRLWDKTIVQVTFGALEEQYCRWSFNSCKMSTWSSMVQYNLNHSGCTHPGIKLKLSFGGYLDWQFLPQANIITRDVFMLWSVLFVQIDIKFYASDILQQWKKRKKHISKLPWFIFSVSFQFETFICKLKGDIAHFCKISVQPRFLED